MTLRISPFLFILFTFEGWMPVLNRYCFQMCKAMRTTKTYMGNKTACSVNQTHRAPFSNLVTSRLKSASNFLPLSFDEQTQFHVQHNAQAWTNI